MEMVLERHYGPILKTHGIRLFVAKGKQKTQLVDELRGDVGPVDAEKIDVFLVGDANGKPVPFGVVHVKASFAERRTDDVPLSNALLKAGYTSPIWTMDCKGAPGARPLNKGELGPIFLGVGKDKRRAKRKDVELHGYFSACFSYNRETLPTPPGIKVKSRVVVCDLNDPNDAFTEFIIAEWSRFSRENLAHS